MKFIHVSDLHFGKNLFGYSMITEGDQIFWIKQFLKLVRSEDPDAIVIAGDVYDRGIPPKEAVKLLDSFMTELSSLNIPVFMIAGNHDSGERLQFGSSLFKNNNIYIAGEVTKEIVHKTIEDEYGEVTFWLVPYLFPAAVEVALEDDDIKGYDMAMRKLLAAQNIDFSKRNVIISHQTVMNNGSSPETDGSETAIGGVGDIDVSVYDGFDYVALGHIHAAQKVGRDNIRYSGSPLCYHFGELRKSHKGPVIVTLKEKGNFEYRVEELPVLHNMREIKGLFNDILEKESLSKAKNEYLRVVLTDERVPSGARATLLSLFESKNSKMMEIVHEPATRAKSEHKEREVKAEIKTIEDYFSLFYQNRNNDEFPEEDDQMLISFIAEQVRHSSDDEKPTEPSSKDIDKIVEFVMKQEAE